MNKHIVNSVTLATNIAHTRFLRFSFLQINSKSDLFCHHTTVELDGVK
jgi:hypothetical protein